MKRIVIAFVFVLVSSIGFSQDTIPELLTEPADWGFEKMELPLDFAPDIDVEGFEELRFAPGMFDTLSPNHFTYMFAIELKNIYALNKNELIDFLNKYYKGLCAEVGKANGMEPDVDEVFASMINYSEKNNRYQLTLVFFDTFTNGKKIMLKMEVDIMENKENSYMVALVSKQPFDSAIFKTMRKYRKKVIKNIDL